MEKIDNTKFYDAMNNYYATNEKRYRDIMFIEINNVCKGIIRKMSNRCKGIYSRQDLDDFALDACCRVMQRIDKTKPVIRNVTNYCWLWCKAIFTTYPMLPQAKFESSIESIEISSELQMS